MHRHPRETLRPDIYPADGARCSKGAIKCKSMEATMPKLSPAKKAARTRKRRAAGRKAARTRRLRAAGRKAAETRRLGK